jgi:ribonuclease R
MNDGAISFDKVEVKFNLVEVNPRVFTLKFQCQLIEEFMLLANRKVAEFIGKQKKTFIFMMSQMKISFFAMQALISNLDIK